MHVRQAIREAFVSECTGLTTTGANVKDTRFYPYDPDNTPALAIYAKSESSEYGSQTALLRVAQIVVEGVAEAVGAIEDTLDDIAAEVETVVTTAAAIRSAGAKDVMLAETEIDTDERGAKKIAVIRLTFDVSYITERDAPEVAK